MYEKCDVVIIGAGVSGSVAALKAAKAGLRTVLVEKKTRLGEANAKLDITRDVGITDIVGELSLDIGDHSNVSKWFSPNGSFTLKSKIGDYFVKRGNASDCFEVSTSMKAQDAGAELAKGIRIKGAVKNGTTVKELTLENGKVLAPEHIIVASGQEPETLMSLGLMLEETELVHFFAYGQVLSGINIEELVTHAFFNSELMPQGYFYMGKDSNGFGAAVMVVSLKGAANTKEIYNRFVSKNSFVKNALTKSKSVNIISGSRYAAKITTRVRGNVMLVGDSGRFMDPLLGYGVNQSIYTGYWAAASIKAQNNKLFEEKIERVLDETKQGRTARRTFESMTNGDFDLLMGAVNELKNGIDVDDFLDNPAKYPMQIAKMILKKPGLIPLLRQL